jgi:LysR family transcriptional regulator, hydrogen peroxide-inducible genes activator
MIYQIKSLDTIDRRSLTDGGAMTLQELRYLVALADEGHFARAAERCHVGQPTLSTQLKKLEDFLGVALFERGKRIVVPTPMGEEIIAQARIVLEEAGKLRQLADRGQNPMAGPLRLGIIPTLGPYLLPHLLPIIHAAYPLLRLLLREDLTQNLLAQLRAGKLDVLLLALPVNVDGLETAPLFQEPFVAALPADHPLTAQREVRRSDLRRQYVLLLEEGHCLREQALDICGMSHSDTGEEFKATSLETLRQMVAAGAGCTLLPALAALPTTGLAIKSMIETRPFAEPVPSRIIGLVWRRSFPRAKIVHNLKALIFNHLPQGVAIVS